MKINRKIFSSFGDFVLLVEILEKYITPLGSPGVFVISMKNIFKLRRLFMASRNSRKLLSIFRKSWNVCKFIEKYS